jgi:energy-coupling factor transporter ATP-binding protein EcfA2
MNSVSLPRNPVILRCATSAGDMLMPRQAIMLTSLKIQRFRSFQALSIEGLTRVNVVVGSNNAGKTTILEAADVLLSSIPATALWRAGRRREEWISFPDPDRPPSGVEVDIRHVFLGHRMEPGASFSIVGPYSGEERSVTCQVITASPADPEQVQLPIPDRVEPEPLLALEFRGTHLPAPPIVPLTQRGGLSRDIIRRRFAVSDGRQRISINLTTPGFASDDLVPLWDTIVLTPEETHIVDALRIVEPELERIAATSSRYRGVILAKISGLDRPVPLGSMGDGMRYLLSLSMHIVASGGGCLLVDEIDTGLHYSVMSKMWTLVLESARRLDVQVIASTHSLDCLRALAVVCRRDPEAMNDVAVHRVERGRHDSVRYSAEELEAAISHEMEIR